MLVRLRWFVILVTLLWGCLPNDEWYLDSAIPRVVTPPEQIATVRTKWINGKLLQTAFLDKQDRILEDFRYGRSNEKTLNRYEGNNNVFSIHHYYNDDGPHGHVAVDTTHREFDKLGRVIVEEKALVRIEMPNQPITIVAGRSRRSFTYKANGDTIIIEPGLRIPASMNGTVTNSSRWEHDRKGRVIRHRRLLVWKGNSLDPHNTRLDTVEYYSQRFAYDPAGRKILTWFDLMYLGRLYWPMPDTIRYVYNKHNRLIQELHQYTTDMRNKVELDTTSQEPYERHKVTLKPAKIDRVDYRYEPFNPAKHLPLHVSLDVDY